MKYSDFYRRVNAPINKTTKTPLDYGENFDAAQPSIAANYTIAPGWTAYAQAARGFLAPPIAVFQANQIGAVRPETTWNYQIGTAVRRSRWMLGADLYNINFSNYIASSEINVAGLGQQTNFVNAGGPIYQGVELEGQYALGRGFSLYGNWSYNSAEYKGTSVRIAETPRELAAFGLLFDDRKGPYFSVIGKYVGGRYGLDSTTSATNQTVFANQYPVGGYVTADLAAGWVFRGLAGPLHEITPSIKISNLFDSYQVSDFARQRIGHQLGLPRRRAAVLARSRHKRVLQPERGGVLSVRNGSTSRVVVANLLATVVFAFAAAASAAQPMLERVVLVSRHGVRAPTQSAEALKAATGLDWPAWPVGPGELTPHGARDLSLMGGFLRERYAAQGLLRTNACPAAGAVQVWADGADSRTRQSGQILADALAPGCGLQAAHGAPGATDPLFDAAQPGVCPVEPQAALAALNAETGGGEAIVRPQETRALAALQAVLAPDACATGANACLQGPSAFAVSKRGVKLTGRLAIGGTAAENLLLEYAQGFPAERVGWGRAGVAARIAAVMPAHERVSDLSRRSPYVAAHNGAVMARTALDLLQGVGPSDPHAPPLSPGARITVLAGHDTNLANMAGVFGLSWTLPDQPDSTAPDTVLAFELWRDGASGAPTVRVTVFSQSLDQLRNATPLDATRPAGVTTVALPLCAAGGRACGLSDLVAAVTARLPRECLARR